MAAVGGGTSHRVSHRMSTSGWEGWGRASEAPPPRGLAPSVTWREEATSGRRHEESSCRRCNRCGESAWLEAWLEMWHEMWQEMWLLATLGAAFSTRGDARKREGVSEVSLLRRCRPPGSADRRHEAGRRRQHQADRRRENSERRVVRRVARQVARAAAMRVAPDAGQPH